MAFGDRMYTVGKVKSREKRTKTAQRIAIGAGIATVAAATGIVTGILIAPKPGHEMREDLKKICIHGIARQGCCACEGGDGLHE